MPAANGTHLLHITHTPRKNKSSAQCKLIGKVENRKRKSAHVENTIKNVQLTVKHTIFCCYYFSFACELKAHKRFNKGPPTLACPWGDALNRLNARQNHSPHTYTRTHTGRPRRQRPLWGLLCVHALMRPFPLT